MRGESGLAKLKSIQTTHSTRESRRHTLQRILHCTIQNQSANLSPMESPASWPAQYSRSLNSANESIDCVWAAGFLPYSHDPTRNIVLADITTNNRIKKNRKRSIVQPLQSRVFPFACQSDKPDTSGPPEQGNARYRIWDATEECCLFFSFYKSAGQCVGRQTRRTQTGKAKHKTKEKKRKEKGESRGFVGCEKSVNQASSVLE